jgi:formate hydrogenlyase subunit 4
MKSALIWTVQIILVPVLSPLFAGIIRKIKAGFQNRVGAKITQPYYDLWKLFHKDEVISQVRAFRSLHPFFPVIY